MWCPVASWGLIVAGSLWCAALAGKKTFRGDIPNGPKFKEFQADQLCWRSVKQYQKALWFYLKCKPLLVPREGLMRLINDCSRQVMTSQILGGSLQPLILSNLVCRRQSFLTTSEAECAELVPIACDIGWCRPNASCRSISHADCTLYILPDAWESRESWSRFACLFSFSFRCFRIGTTVQLSSLFSNHVNLS